MKWLLHYLELIQETRASNLAEVKVGIDRLVKRVRVLSSDSQEVHEGYADLLDFYSEPARKAVVTRKKNQQSTDGKKSES